MILCFRKRFCCHAAGGGVCKFAVHTVRNGCSTCSGLLTTGRWWSASLNISDRVGSSRPQYPSCWHRLTSESSFAMWPAEHMLCHARPAYVIFAKRVARKTSCSDSSGMLWTRSCSAYSKLLRDASKLLTWSAADEISLTVTPRMRILLTCSMSRHGAGRLANFPRLPRAQITIRLSAVQR